MAFNNNIPLATDRLSKSQADLLGNFVAIKTLVDQNHETFGSGSDGKHKFLQMPEQAAGGGIATLANEAGLYARVGATSGVSELYFKREGLAAATEGIAFTEGTNAVEGYTRLPSGLLIRWGERAGEDDFTLIRNNAPFFNQIFHVQITPITDIAGSNNKTVVLRTWVLVPGVSFTLNLTGVERLSNTAINTRCYWMILGI